MLPPQNFVDGQGPVIGAAWLNAIDALTQEPIRADLIRSQLASDASGEGTSLVAFMQRMAGAVARTAESKLADAVSVKDFGAVGDDVADDAPAIKLAAAAAAAIGATLKFPAGVYRVVPATAQTGAASYNCAVEILSDLQCIGEFGATIKVADNYSTDASPKELAIFSLTSEASNVTFSGITFDLNGANNLMSPGRPAVYNTFNHAAILVNGPSGRASKVTIENCVFKNNAGVCFVVAQLVAAGTTPTLGINWTIKNNLFLNGGMDSSDHTSVYGFGESFVLDGNLFWQDNPPHTVGKTGGATGWEIHGSNHRCFGNYVFNYTLGMYVGPNFTNTTLNSMVYGNIFYTSDYGILLWRQIAPPPVLYLEISGVQIFGNIFYFDGYTYSGGPTYKAAIGYQGQIASAQGSINNVKIHGNLEIYVGATLLTQFVHWDSSTTASQLCSNIVVEGNTVIGATEGVHVITNGANSQGFMKIARNDFIALKPDSLGNPAVGIRINATGGFKTLVIDANTFVDEQAIPTFGYGVYLEGGTVTDFYYGPQVFKGLTVANYTETGGFAVTNWLGPQRSGINTITYSTTMVPDSSASLDQVVTATNGTAFAFDPPIRGQIGTNLTITVRNASGGALGAVTWNAIYGLAAWTQPANGFSRSITFRYNGTLWIEKNRTPADVPN